MSKVKTLDSGGFFFEANPRLEYIDVSGLNELGELTYFIIRHNPYLRQVQCTRLLRRTSSSRVVATILSNSSSDYSDENFCPTDSTFPTQMCDSSSACTDAYYLWARENDYDFEENTVQISGPPQYSAVEWKRNQRYVQE
eukprot:scaffold15742_cov178-Skeletonema_marinoi.AAC.4